MKACKECKEHKRERVEKSKKKEAHSKEIRMKKQRNDKKTNR